MQVEVSNEQELLEVSESLEAYIIKAAGLTSEFAGGDPAGEASIVLIDDAHIQELNKSYRAMDCATDVLSFALMESNEAEPQILGLDEDHLLGDVFISLETAQRQAIEYGHSLTREIVFLAVHGMLHLLGYDHQIESDTLIMRQKEEEIMGKLDLRRE
ncbi:MAG: rRNA maturation RNase YbeY [Peptococcaceae bacterium]|nr:rRNA maturation RNase YbeY [Peptococcaceae bacterium]